MKLITDHYPLQKIFEIEGIGQKTGSDLENLLDLLTQYYQMHK